MIRKYLIFLFAAAALLAAGCDMRTEIEIAPEEGCYEFILSATAETGPDTRTSYAEDKVFSKFEDLADNDAFSALREQWDKYTIEELEETCYAIRGRYGSFVKFSADPKPATIIVEETQSDNEPYGGLFAEYGVE